MYFHGIQKFQEILMSRIEKIGGRRKRFSRRDYYIKTDLGHFGIEKYNTSSDYLRKYPCGPQ